MRDWNTLARNREARLARAAPLSTGKVVAAADAGALLERVLEAGDRVCLEGNNQKQADFLAKVLAALDPAVVHDLHMVQSVLALPEHLDVFERGVASRLDFSFSGPQAGTLGPPGELGPDRHRGDPHLPRAVRPLLCRSDAPRQPRGGTSRGSPPAISTPARIPRTRRSSSRPRRSSAASSSRR